LTLPTAGRRYADVMTDPKTALTDTSDQMLVELAHLKSTEALKRREPISTPAFHALEDEVYLSSRRIYANAMQQDKLGQESETGEVSIDDIDRERAMLPSPS
jgi:hypothetical protein